MSPLESIIFQESFRAGPRSRARRVALFGPIRVGNRGISLVTPSVALAA
ncbi:hypothetical protein SO3561_05527 [Streptomyces olivochromogenes]|uniref:Uncharacterized protein n=1 Tax=Streptomyces olivochromogenes TaxID=1963 RepID=A0A250VII8_STROL|nr:hypothetical protein SO3561_05527 [Streptomyces olivochromogenes]